MAADFVALADLLRAPGASAGESQCALGAAPSTAAPRAAAAAAPELGAQAVFDADGVCDVLREARLFRARLADALDDAAARLLRELASDVLARELKLAPCDLAAVVRRIIARAPALRVRVSAFDLACGVALPRGCDVAVVEDPALGDGDAIVEVVGGALDARLGVRLATVLEGFA